MQPGCRLLAPQPLRWLRSAAPLIDAPTPYWSPRLHAEAAAKVAAGEADAYVSDSSVLNPGGGLKIVSGLPPLNPVPYGVAVAKNNTALASK